MLAIESQKHSLFPEQTDLTPNIPKVTENSDFQPSQSQVFNHVEHKDRASCNPHISFQLISTLAATNNLWIKITKLFVEQSNFEKIEDAEAETSCIHTLFPISYIFLGHKKGKIVMSEFMDVISITFFFEQKNGLKFQFSVQNLFSNMPQDQDGRNLKERNFKILTNDDIESFENHIEPSLENVNSINDYQNVLKNLKWDFNKKVIDQLRTDIYRHRGHLDTRVSFVYFVCILEITTTDKAKINFYHCFAVEQFYNPIQQTDGYRLYESFHSLKSLDEHFQQKRYGKKGENCEKWPEINQLFKRIQMLLSPSSGLSKQQISALQKKCFGCSTKLSQPIKYIKSTNTLTGRSFRYQCHKLENNNSKTALQNLNEASSGTPLSQEISNFLKEFNRNIN